MKAVVTRVSEASVTIDGSVVGSIGKGFLILLGVGPEDTSVQCKKLAEKVLGLRVFEDENGKMNLDLAAVGGQVLVVSQFTLYADVSHGRRPSFTGAAHPTIAIPLYEQFLQECADRGFVPQHGEFGADMKKIQLADYKSYFPVFSAKLLAQALIQPSPPEGSKSVRPELLTSFPFIIHVIKYHHGLLALSLLKLSTASQAYLHPLCVECLWIRYSFL